MEVDKKDQASPPINYAWDSVDNSNENGNQSIDDDFLKTRFDIQIIRRLFHMFMGGSMATLYLITLEHSQMIHLLGTIASVIYVVEQIRVNYPETASKLMPFTRFVMRAEEQLKESAMIPYALAVLLTIITFPKQIALVGIYSLAFADPISAIVGIKYGKHKITTTRSAEGSLAFFISIFTICLAILTYYHGSLKFLFIFISIVVSFTCTVFDLIKIKLDDNLTIPLFTAAVLWFLLAIFGIKVS